MKLKGDMKGSLELPDSPLQTHGTDSGHKAWKSEMLSSFQVICTKLLLQKHHFSTRFHSLSYSKKFNVFFFSKNTKSMDTDCTALACYRQQHCKAEFCFVPEFKNLVRFFSELKCSLRPLSSAREQMPSCGLQIDVENAHLAVLIHDKLIALIYFDPVARLHESERLNIFLTSFTPFLHISFSLHCLLSHTPASLVWS